jgi:S-(hydroxymethyl)mycothiol dehydrogenase
VDLQRAVDRVRTVDGLVATPSLRLGTHATHVVVAAGQAIPVSPDLSPAALCTIGCAVMTGVGAVVNTAAVRRGDRVAVLGCGGVGLSVVQGARLARAAVIVAVDRRPDKLEVARRVGATHTIVSGPGDDAAAQVRDATGGFGVDHAFEAVGTGEVVSAAIRCCDVGGTATIIGTPARDARLDLAVSDLFFSRLTVKVSQYGDAIPSRDVPVLVRAYRDGELLLDELVSREIDLSEAPAALAALETGDVLRSVIRFAPA